MVRTDLLSFFKHAALIGGGLFIVCTVFPEVPFLVAKGVVNVFDRCFRYDPRQGEILFYKIDEKSGKHVLTSTAFDKLPTHAS